jgi:flagellar protein FlaG
MQVEAISVTGSTLQQQPKAADGINAGRKALEKGQPDLEKSSAADKGGVQPEEILTQIKALTENGLYSVRFENSQEFNELVVKVVDTKTDEVIRQIPAEEVLGMKAILAELSGKIVNTVR